MTEQIKTTMYNNAMVSNNITNNAMKNNVRSLIKVNKADAIADKLVKELGNEDYRAFYCKVAYKLTEAQIWSSLEIAKTGNNPAKYFTWLVKRQM